MIRKTYEGTYFKALDDSTGEFEAVVSVFGNVDLQGDRTMPGAFTKSLDEWRGRGDPIPVIWSHDWGDPFAHIGYVDPADAYEVLAGDEKAMGDIKGGLFVKGRLDVDKPYARQVYDLLKDRRVTEWSFAYEVIDEERNAKDHANELNEVALFEVGPTLKGANPATVTLGVKSILEDAVKMERGLKKINWALGVDSQVGMKMLQDWVREDLEKDASNQSGGSFEEKEDEAADDVEEKAEFKPWHIEKQGDKYCVIKDSDGSTESCHDTREDAMAAMRALYAAEGGMMEDSGKSLVDLNSSSTAGSVSVTISGDVLSQEDMAEVVADAFEVGNKAGRAISKETEEKLRAAQQLLADILMAVDLPDEDEKSVEETDVEEKSAEQAELEEYKRKLGLLDL